MNNHFNRRGFQSSLVATGLLASLQPTRSALGQLAFNPAQNELAQNELAQKEQTRKYRVGIIGATGRGDYGHAVDVPFTKLPNVEIVACADANPQGLAKATERLGPKKSYADYKEMLGKETLDLVAICPRWIDQHFEMLAAAAQANCHVYMEKPFCRSLLECDQIRKDFEAKNLKLAIAHTGLYSPVLDTSLKLIRQGAIGEVLELRARGKEDHRGGAEDLWVLGSHIFALMRSFAQGDPIRCSAKISHQGQPIRKEHVVDGNEGLGPLAGDDVQALYTFPNGIRGSFGSRKSMAANPSRFALQVFGSKGVLEIESGYLAPAYILQDGSWSPGRSGKKWEKVTSAGIGLEEPIKEGTYEAGHLAAIGDLMLAIENQREPKCSLRDALGITEMILATFESQRAGQEIALPLESRIHPLTLLG
ncbi:MAG: Gfo/Idh/MocA family oxidoreductase [Planctomycetota bacterium]|nr:Gfo/Idh/MocA family oxidoreductase [Planctomycetota bacterium]